MSDKISKRMRSECRWVLLCGFADECRRSLHLSQYVTIMHEKSMACFEHKQHQTTNYTITWGTQPHFDAEEQRGDIEAVPIIATRLRSTHTHTTTTKTSKAGEHHGEHQPPSIWAPVHPSQYKIKHCTGGCNMITCGSLLIKKQLGLHDQSSSRGLCQAWIFKHLRQENVLLNPHMSRAPGSNELCQRTRDQSQWCRGC